MNIAFFLVALVSMSCGAIVQSVLGFGMGIVSIPMVVSAGYPMEMAMGVLMPNVLCQTIFSCWRLRAELPWRESLRMIPLRLAGLCLGVYLLKRVAESGESVAHLLLGLGLLGMLFIPSPSPQAAPRPTSTIVTAFAAFLSGVLMGLIAMGGPPLVIWVMKQNWPQQRRRAFLWLTFLLVLPAQIVLMRSQFAESWGHGFWLGLHVVPLVMLVSWLSGTWADRLSNDRVRLGMKILLFALALQLLLTFAIAYLPTGKGLH